MQSRQVLDELLEFVNEYLDTGGPFPDRLHVVSLTVEVIAELLATLEVTFQRTAAEVDEWSTTKDRGLDAATRTRLEQIRDRYRS